MDVLDEILACVIGVLTASNIIFIARWMMAKRQLHSKKQGALFITEANELYSEFYVPIDVLAGEKTILMDVHSLKE